MSVTENKIMVYHRDSDRFIKIDPTTDCNRCGTKVTGDSGAPDFKICPFHCGACESTSPTPNKMSTLRDHDGSEYLAPVCENCRIPDEFFAMLMNNGGKVTGFITNREKADQKPDFDY